MMFPLLYGDIMKILKDKLGDYIHVPEILYKD